MITLRQIGAQIKKRRKELGMSQAELSDLIGYGITYISLIENGKRNIDLLLFLVICDALQVDVKKMLKE